MEDLNQHQMVLLVLLISFVTSIATGIITVSLLQEAPLEVTRNINRVVEKTIETVTPSTNILGTKEKEITTVVVKEDDQIVGALNKNIKSIARISEEDSLGAKSFYGIGIVVGKDGSMISDRKVISSSNIYYAKFNDGSEFKIVPKGVDHETNSLLFKANLPEGEKYDFIPVKISNSDVQLGQTIMALGGDKTDVVIVGRASSLNMKESGVGTSTTKYLSSVDTDMSSGEMYSGTPFFNLSGELIGLKLYIGSSSFTPISILNKELKILQE